MNQLIQNLAAALLILAALTAILSLTLTSRLPRPGPKTTAVLTVAFLLVITPKR